MSGVFGNPWLYNPATPFYPFEINQSLRFEDGDSAHLDKTYSSSAGGNTKTWTWSCWVKIGDISAQKMIFSGSTNSSNLMYLQLRGDSQNNRLDITWRQGSGTTRGMNTNRQFRDISSWYHIVWAVDTTQSTDAYKIRLYINGAEETSFSSDDRSTISQNSDLIINANSAAHSIGTYSYSPSAYFDGYMAEVHFVDGLQLDHTSFGQTKAGIWIPKNYTGSHGTTGFYLPFDDGSALGDDESANTNDWTPSGFVATDVVDDTPTRNFAVMNPRDGNSPDVQEGNLKVYGDTSFSVFEGCKGTFPMSSGKWYWEVYINVGGFTQTGITPTTNTAVISSTNLSYHTDAMTYESNGKKAIGTGGTGTAPTGRTASNYGATYTTGDIIGVALDLDSSPTTLTFYKNNSTQGAAFSSLASDEYVAVHTGIQNNFGVFNFGQDSSFANNKTSGSAEAADANGVGDFFYTPPSGFLACSVSNLTSPAVNPAENQDPENNFKTVLYAGDGNSSQSVDLATLNPDFVWIKSTTNNSGHHSLGNRVVGDFFMNSNQNVDEYSFSAFNFNSDNTIDVPVSANDYSMNTSSQSYVAWTWLAGGSTPSKTYKVVVVSDSGNKYRFRDSADSTTFAQSAVELNLQEGGTYTFDQSDSTMSSHPMKLSTTSNGSHGGGSTYSTGVTYELDDVNVTESAFVSGFSSATSRKLIITVAASAPTLYYFCHYHSGMGGQINTNSTFGSTNFDGTILATVCENATTGISIIGWTGNQVNNTVIPHGLGANADVVITKRRSANSDWLVLHSAVATNTSNVLRLNSNAGTTNGSSTLSQGCPDEFTSVGFKVVQGTGSTMTNVNGSGSTYIAYAFKSSDGFSSFGSYIGNGSSDGPYIYTGFRVTWLMMKSTSVGDWYIWDATRDIDNGVRLYLRARLANQQGGTSSGQQYFDFLSNGFKIIADSSAFSEGNSSGQEYIYFAFAEQPFKFSNAR